MQLHDDVVRRWGHGLRNQEFLHDMEAIKAKPQGLRALLCERQLAGVHGFEYRLKFVAQCSHRRHTGHARAAL